MRNLLGIAVLLALLWFLFPIHGSVSTGPGVFAADDPIQETINPPEQYEHDEYTIHELASFDITAKVLAREDYRLGREADLSPTDLALGWGRMSDESVLESIEISQSNRFYFWRVENFPIPRKEIETHSANMHLIPANSYVADAIDDVRIGDIITLSGSLVKVTADDGWRWKSSLTRNDTGNGACELIFVESFEIVTP